MPDFSKEADKAADAFVVVVLLALLLIGLVVTIGARFGTNAPTAGIQNQIHGGAK